MTIVDQPDWASPSGGTPAQVIGQPIGTTGELILGEDPFGNALPIQVDGAGRLITAGGGGGNVTVHDAPFAYNSSGLDTGYTLVFNDGYSCPAGDLVLDAWIEIITGWDNFSPPNVAQGDIGFFASTGQGWFQSICGYTLTMFEQDEDGIPIPNPYGLLCGKMPTSILYSSIQASIIAGLYAPGPSFPSGIVVNPHVLFPFRYFPAKLNVGDPLQVVVSKTGQTGGGYGGWTQGQAIVHLVTATPL